MKHLHYGSLVVAISDDLANTIEEAAVAFMNEGRTTSWPVACYRDDREEISVQLVFGPGIPFAISSPWLEDPRPPARYTDSSIEYIQSERESLEADVSD